MYKTGIFSGVAIISCNIYMYVRARARVCKSVREKKFLKKVAKIFGG